VNSVSAEVDFAQATNQPCNRLEVQGPGKYCSPSATSDGKLPFDEAWIEASYTPAAQRTAAQSELLTLSDKLIDEVLAADVIVLGIPMHNFSVPASFKAWIDQIARAGKTFSYTDKGPKGLIPSDKKVVALLSRGSAYSPDGASEGGDFQVAYLRQILGFIGLTDITFVHADQQGMGGQTATLAAEKAGQQLTSILQGRPHNDRRNASKQRDQRLNPHAGRVRWFWAND
jgi:FMN-dependent NADH-azoreductase